MPTLYELLEALPEDDADGLRKAFRKAAKAHHPDNNPDDPDAAQRFRRVVRAHAILGDDEQRATYDACLGNAQQQRARNSKRNIFSRLRRLAPDVVSSIVIALMSIGAFLLVEKASTMRVTSARTVPVSALAAAMPTEPSDTVGRAAEHHKLDHVPVVNAPAAQDAVKDAVKEIAAPVAAATVDNTGVVPATSDVVVKDAGYYRDRGGLAYRSGDLPMALIDFDLAINLDPNSAEAYIDRAIVFRRMGDMKRALADVAEAKRIADLRPQQTAPLSGNN